MTASTKTLIPNPESLKSRLASVERDCIAFLHDGQVLVTVAPFIAKGTHDQNRMAHKLWEHIANQWNAGHPGQPTSPAAVKDEMKQTYGMISTEYSPLTGKRVARLMSWSEYSRRQRSDLITATLAYMAEAGIPDLPGLSPDEYLLYREVQG